MRAVGVTNAQAIYISTFVRKGTKIHVTRDVLSYTHGVQFIPLI